MALYSLIIGNKNYSSWSMRPWLMMTASDIPFEETVIALDTPNTRQEILRHSPSGQVPVLKDGELTVWDSLSIGEYLAEKHPEAKLWPDDPIVRARARSVSAEMHSGFDALRQHMPMNVRSSFPGHGRAPGVQEDINRILAIWRNHRRQVTDPAGGPFLFGRFSIADAMFAPVVSRFRTYGVEVTDEAAAYAEALWNMPAMQTWIEDARNEPMVIDNHEF